MILIEIFSDLYRVVLLADLDEDGPVGLDGFFLDLVGGMIPLQLGLVMGHLVLNRLQSQIIAQGIILGRKVESLQQAGRFNTLQWVHLLLTIVPSKGKCANYSVTFPICSAMYDVTCFRGIRRA